MKNTYSEEIDDFYYNFASFRDNRIVIYGIGRYTATLLDGVKDYNFVGLMDKDSARIGTTIFGLPIVSLNEAEKIADIIIINTSETYWRVIFSRIENALIPIYFKNGKQAIKAKKEEKDCKYNNLSIDDLKRCVYEADIVSFDFFDTLFCRSVSRPQDVFEMLPIPVEIRNKAKNRLAKDYSFDELYDEIGRIGDYSGEYLELVKNQEIQIEHKILKPRGIVFDFFRELVSKGKEIYIISDMYLPKKFYLDVFGEYDISIGEDRIIVSNEIGCSKSDVMLWERYSNEFVKGRRALHIGDNLYSDVEIPKTVGIDTYYIPNNWDLFQNSSGCELLSKCQTTYDSRILGLILNKYYEDPFRDVKNNGKIFIKDEFEMGYIVFGPLILTFLLWLEDKKEKCNIDKLLFLARDGYLLKEDYELFCELIGKECRSEYVIISRQLAHLASCETKDDVYEYMSIPYSGSINELFEDRLGIIIDSSDNKSIFDYVDDNWIAISKIVNRVGEYYKGYLSQFDISENDAIVDQGYYGNNQYFLNKLTDLNIGGLYFCANLSDKNPNARRQMMSACFQNVSDLTAEKSSVAKNMIYLESFMTAPYGMVKYVNDAGEFIYDKLKNNQLFFSNRTNINNGVKKYIKDYIVHFNCKDCLINYTFSEFWYGVCFGGSVGYLKEIQDIFFNDNGMMHRIESSLFE